MKRRGRLFALDQRPGEAALEVAQHRHRSRAAALGCRAAHRRRAMGDPGARGPGACRRTRRRWRRIAATPPPSRRASLTCARRRAGSVRTRQAAPLVVERRHDVDGEPDFGQIALLGVDDRQQPADHRLVYILATGLGDVIGIGGVMPLRCPACIRAAPSLSKSPSRPVSTPKRPLGSRHGFGRYCP